MVEKVIIGSALERTRNRYGYVSEIDPFWRRRAVSLSVERAKALY
jgi:hypothetical protein